MIRFDVVPKKSFNGVEFNTDRQTVRNALGEAKEFKKSKFSKNTTDDFGCCHVYYSADNKCVAVEFFDDVEIFIDNEKIFPCEVSDFQKRFEDTIEEYGSYVSKEHSIAIYAPDGKPESILFGIENYYV